MRIKIKKNSVRDQKKFFSSEIYSDNREKYLCLLSSFPKRFFCRQILLVYVPLRLCTFDIDVFKYSLTLRFFGRNRKQ